jgi:hypothetical protein
MLKHYALLLSIVLFSINGFGDNKFESDYTFCNHHKLKFFLKKIYDVYLCTNNKNSFLYSAIYQSDFSVFIKYNMGFESSYLAETSIESMGKNFVMSKFKQQSYYNILANIFPNVEKGDVIEARYSKAGIVKFFFNNNDIGVISSDPIFTKKFLDIWLRYNANAPKMQENLFGFVDE